MCNPPKLRLPVWEIPQAQHTKQILLLCRKGGAELNLARAELSED